MVRHGSYLWVDCAGRVRLVAVAFGGPGVGALRSRLRTRSARIGALPRPDTPRVLSRARGSFHPPLCSLTPLHRRQHYHHHHRHHDYIPLPTLASFVTLTVGINSPLYTRGEREGKGARFLVVCKTRKERIMYRMGNTLWERVRRRNRVNEPKRGNEWEENSFMYNDDRNRHRRTARDSERERERKIERKRKRVRGGMRI